MRADLMPGGTLFLPEYSKHFGTAFLASAGHCPPFGAPLPFHYYLLGVSRIFRFALHFTQYASTCSMG